MTRWESEDVRERMPPRLANHPEMMLQRKAMAEHPCGTLKRGRAQGYFRMRGKQHGRTDMSLSLLAYNITRVVNILGVEPLLAALA
jgi:hypothetical protein